MTDLTTRIADVKKKALEATPGPWNWWTSNSWRRLKRYDRGITQNVLEPYVCRDGHPDLSISEEDMAYIAAASPDLILAMAAEIDRLTAQLDKAREALEPFALAAATYDKCKPTRPMRFVWEFDKTLEVGHLRTAARVGEELKP